MDNMDIVPLFVYRSSLAITKYIFNVLRNGVVHIQDIEKSEVKYAELDYQSLTGLHAHSWAQIQRGTPFAPCVVKSSFKTGLQISNRRSLLSVFGPCVHSQ
jgi:hypothetical protein